MSNENENQSENKDGKLVTLSELAANLAESITDQLGASALLVTVGIVVERCPIALKVVVNPALRPDPQDHSLPDEIQAAIKKFLRSHTFVLSPLETSTSESCAGWRRN